MKMYMSVSSMAERPTLLREREAISMCSFQGINTLALMESVSCAFENSIRRF